MQGSCDLNAGFRFYGRTCRALVTFRTTTTMSLVPLSTTTVLLALCLCLLVVMKKSKKTALGPLGLPLIGNLLDMPKKMEWEQYNRWSKEYGTPVTLQIVVPNSEAS